MVGPLGVGVGVGWMMVGALGVGVGACVFGPALPAVGTLHHRSRSAADGER